MYSTKHAKPKIHFNQSHFSTQFKLGIFESIKHLQLMYIDEGRKS